MSAANTMRPNWLSGFSLVEIMIGLTVGLVASVTIMGVYENYEKQKRTTSSSSEAQVNGSFSTFLLDRQLRSAGSGLATGSGFGCLTNFYASSAADTPVLDPLTGDAPVASGQTVLMPALVVDGGDSGAGAGQGLLPDRLHITYTKSSFNIPYTLASASAAAPYNLTLDNTYGLYEGDWVLLAQYGWRFSALSASPMCTLARLTASDGLPSRSAATPSWQASDPNLQNVVKRDASGPNLSSGAISYVPGDQLMQLRALVMEHYYVNAPGTATPANVTAAVTDTNALLLVSRDTSSLATAPSTAMVSPNVVNLQVQYGLDDGCGEDTAHKTADDDIVDRWVDAVALTTACGARTSFIDYTKRDALTNRVVRQPDGATTPYNDYSASGLTGTTSHTTVLAVAARRQIKALRVTLLVRSDRMEGVGTGCNTTTVSPAVIWPVAAGVPVYSLAGKTASGGFTQTLDVERSSSDWKCFRYRAFQTVVPLRAVIWSDQQ